MLLSWKAAQSPFFTRCRTHYLLYFRDFRDPSIHTPFRIQLLDSASNLGKSTLKCRHECSPDTHPGKMPKRAQRKQAPDLTVENGHEVPHTKTPTNRNSQSKKAKAEVEEHSEHSAAEIIPELPDPSPSQGDESKSKPVKKKEKKKPTKASLAAESQAAMAAAAQSSTPWKVLIHRKAESDWFPYDPVTMRKKLEPLGSGQKKLVKIVSWNVNGLRALLGKSKSKRGKEEAEEKKRPLEELVEREDPDVLCLQETKLQEKDVEAIKEGLLPKFKSSYWSCSTAKLGYSGCALFAKEEPISVKYGLGIPKLDTEGRLIAAEFETFFVVVVYVPNAGENLERLGYREKEWDPALSDFVKELEKSKPVVLVGDMNVAHEEIDIYHPEGNRRSAGFTQEERDSFGQVFLRRGLADTFRIQHPKAVAYTYWAYRSGARPKNAGWRLDYVLATEALLENAFDSFTIPDVGGSDHCPLGITMEVGKVKNCK